MHQKQCLRMRLSGSECLCLGNRSMDGASALYQPDLLFRKLGLDISAQITVRQEQNFSLLSWDTIFTAEEEVTQTSQTVFNAAVVLM